MFPSVQIDLPPTMVITEGLPGKFTAVQMHLHWGGWDLEASGAEHTIDGIRYMAEVQGPGWLQPERLAVLFVLKAPPFCSTEQNVHFTQMVHVHALPSSRSPPTPPHPTP